MIPPSRPPELHVSGNQKAPRAQTLGLAVPSRCQSQTVLLADWRHNEPSGILLNDQAEGREEEGLLKQKSCRTSL